MDLLVLDSEQVFNRRVLWKLEKRLGHHRYQLVNKVFTRDGVLVDITPAGNHALMDSLWKTFRHGPDIEWANEDKTQLLLKVIVVPKK